MPEQELLEEYASAQADVMDSVQSEIDGILSNSVGPQTLSEHWEAFTSAINFEEPFVRGLFALHAVVLVLVVLLRRVYPAQVTLFVLICVLVGAAEPANRWAAENWRSFATQNYFDEHGVFTGLMFCAPLLLIGFGQLLGFLYEASSLLIKVKRAELRRKAAARAAGGGEGGGEAKAVKRKKRKDD